MTRSQLDNEGMGTHETKSSVPGFLYKAAFLSGPEEELLIARIDSSPWQSTLQRRVQHYGWRYDYKARRVDSTMRLGSLPPWASELAERLRGAILLPHLADQVIVNEYVGSQGISKHIDCPNCFADGVATISLLETWEMILREESATSKAAQLLERGSVAVLTSESRYKWTHEIPKRVFEPGKIRRGRRISITFRKVRLSEGE